jgi:hypothetical protein
MSETHDASAPCNHPYCRPNKDEKQWHQLPWRKLFHWSGFFVLLLMSLACSAGGLVQRVADTPVPTRALAPTFTATPTAGQVLPQIIVTPPSGQTPGVIIIPQGIDPGIFAATVFPQVSDTPLPPAVTDPALPPAGAETPFPPGEGPPLSTPPAPGESPQLLPTATSLPTATFTPLPSPTPTPYVFVESGLVSLRSGPGVEYPLVAQLGPRIPIAIVGQQPEGDWYQLCCVNGGNVWVASTHIQVINDPSGALLVNAEPPPPPTPTPTFTETPTITPTPTATPFPFDRYIGPQFFPTENNFLTIWVKLFVGTPPNEDPAGGYYLKVLFEGIDRPSTNGTNPSAEELFAVGVPGTGYSNLTFNLKYEYRPPDPGSLDPNDPNSKKTPRELIGTGAWQVYVVDGAGNQLSDIVEFRTEPGNPNREVYIAWVRVR